MTELKPLEFNHPELKHIDISACYLCGRKLTGVINKDHVIPNSLFPKGAARRPKLPVHKDCNGGKSMTDERFKVRLLMMSSLSPVAREKLTKEFLLPASEQKLQLGQVNQNIRDYKLARTILEDFTEDSQLVVNGERLVQIRANDNHVKEMNDYLKVMARGLFIRNISGSNPGRPRLIHINRTRLRLQGEDVAGQMEPIVGMIQAAQQVRSLFGQVWDGHFGYVGSESSDTKSSGFIWMDFYDGYGVLAFFK